MFKLIKFIFLLLLVGGITGGFFIFQEYQKRVEQKIQLPDNAVYEVKKGSSFNSVARDLESKKIIKSALVLRVFARLQPKKISLKAGEYHLNKEMTAIDLLELFGSGDKAVQYKHTIIEGRSYKELVKSIQGNQSIKQTLNDADYKDHSGLMKKIGSDYLHPEGAFLADTYHFPKDTTDVEFLKRSHKSLLDHLHKAWEKRGESSSVLKSPYEALILSSIVEKETGFEGERPMIARVFINRLHKKMLLQTDPTVIYGMGERFKGNIRRSDLRRDTPYNTYTRAGLPPSPIATPGREAIQAVLHPPKGEMIYFVAKGDGTSYFSKTLSEHNRAVTKYQRGGRSK
ncbi:MAG: endolytic transglycosylase MltG [Thiotrichaceae bacterium]|nr:endolytic transglycosylase MltG [Thiotrichaceae bacterium]